jgi:hypothetical protein
MRREVYPAARTVSLKLHSYFARQAVSPEDHRGKVATVPDTEITGLTAVGGAVVLTDRYEVLGFGGRASQDHGAGRGRDRRTGTPGATRRYPHLSAAQFVHDQRDAVALVASQDERFTIFEWSPREEVVHAHRIEALLL